MLLSIGLMVKNESKYLDQCLRSVVPILDALESELIVVDTGSTDNTVEIAKEYTDKVYYHEWTNNFSEMRNIVLSYATGEWFFYLDGDEVLKDPTSVITFFQSKKYQKYNSAFMEMNNILSSNNEYHYGAFQALRFFRNDKDFHFKGIIHEQPQAKGPVARIEGQIIHYGYVNDNKELMEYKFGRNVELIKKVLEKDPDNIYHLFQLSQSYAMYGKHKEALEPIVKAYNLANAAGLDKRMYVVNHLASVYFRNKMYREAEEVAQRGLRLKDGYIDLYYFQALSQLELGKYEHSIASFHSYLSLVEDYERGKGIVDLSMVHRTISETDRAHLALCVLSNKLGDYEEAIKHGQKVRNPQVVKDVIPHLVDLYVKQGRIDGLKGLYDKWTGEENIRGSVERAIENKRMSMDEEERRELSLHFANDETPYGILHVVRNDFYEQGIGISDHILERIENLDLSHSDSFYGDILFALIRHKHSVIESLCSVRSDRITGFFVYLLLSYDESKNVLVEWLADDSCWATSAHDRLQVQRIKTAVLYGLLQQDTLGDADYERFFRMYVEVGIEYLESCYHPDVLECGNVSWTRTGADGFLFYLRKARGVDRNRVEYVRLLREALAQDETMKRGIELLLDKVQEQLDNEPVNELEALKSSVMASIKEAINSGELEAAVALVNEYEDIVGLDAQLASAKGIILTIEGRLDEAKEVFLAGLEMESNNPDLLYNMGYLSEQQDCHVEAFKYYSIAKMMSKDVELVSDVDRALTRLQTAGLDDGIHCFPSMEGDAGRSNTSSAKLPNDPVRILYLGWLGRNNVGDDLLFDIFRILLSNSVSGEQDVVVHPFIPDKSSTIDLRRYDFVVLGGGSLLGLNYYESILMKAERLGVPTIAWGSGFDIRDSGAVRSIVEEYETRLNGFRYRHESTTRVLDSAKLVGVRGVLDKLLLGSDSARVIGDPGVIWNRLGLGSHAIPEIDIIPNDERIVLVNWGTSFNNIMGNDELQVQGQLAAALKAMVRDGYRVVIYPMWPEDVKPCRELASQISSDRVILLDKVYDMKRLSYLMERAHLSINLKLHSNIVSAAFGKPFVSLAYGLKCYDFADSIESLDLLIFTDEVSSAKILGKVRYIEEKYGTIEARFSRYIDLYHAEQLGFMDRFVSLIHDETRHRKGRDASGFRKMGSNVHIEKDNQFVDIHNMEIGDNVYIGFGGFFVASGGIRLGNGSILAHKVEILTRNHNYDSSDLKSIPYDDRYLHKPVIIEENVWIGSNVCIVPGVTIGEGAVVGMGAVVTDNVPKYAVVGGNPAKVLKYRDEKVYERLKDKGKIYLAMKFGK